MTTKHTPGPWNAEPMIRDHGFPYTPVMATTLIARVYSTAFGDDEQSLANAALIAAAPAMLAALREARDFVVPCVPSGDDLLALINAAIAKAEGRQ